MDAEALVDALEQIAFGSVSLTTHALGRAAPGVELTLAQWRAMLVLGEDVRGARISTIADRVGVTLPATGRLVRRLERRGLVTLATDEADRRATRARLTDEGIRVREGIIQARRVLLREIASAADPDHRAQGDALVAAIAAEFGRLA